MHGHGEARPAQYSVFVGGQLCFKYHPTRTLPCVPPSLPHFCRTLICKVEEIHTTLRKHLAKEEQLLPLLVQHVTPQVRS